MSSLRERGELLDYSLLYLFSYDVELDLQGQEKLGRFPEGVRLNCFARRDLSRVYNVGRESSVPGNGARAISGKVVWGGDQVLLRDDDVAMSNIRVAIQTDDDATIHMSYFLTGYVGPGGVARITDGKGRDRFGTEDNPTDVPLITSPRFQTTSLEYDWMNGIQSIGFGRAQLVRSKFRRITCDVYGLT
jgi:Protein of unknown function (DUF3237)